MKLESFFLRRYDDDEIALIKYLIDNDIEYRIINEVDIVQLNVQLTALQESHKSMLMLRWADCFENIGDR